jgi:hypothetical protein
MVVKKQDSLQFNKVALVSIVENIPITSKVESKQLLLAALPSARLVRSE